MNLATIVDQWFFHEMGIEFHDFEADEQQRCFDRLKATMAEIDREREAYEQQEREASVKTCRMLVAVFLVATCMWLAAGGFVYWLIH